MKKHYTEEELTAILDRALDAAEEILTPLVKDGIPAVCSLFEAHVSTHLEDELRNIKTHGHRNDDPNDKPPEPVPQVRLLSDKEQKFIIECLRYWQRDMDEQDLNESDLTSIEIDVLCERLNLTDI